MNIKSGFDDSNTQSILGKNGKMTAFPKLNILRGIDEKFNN
jgi:hypothetical protein